MSCYHPIPAAQDQPGEPVRLHPPLGTANLALPCGGCIGCKTDRATQWARRCEYEARAWPTNRFVTLTYDENHLPEKGVLRARDLQLFLKRLRHHVDGNRRDFDRDSSAGIRFFACGEYGTLSGRPHYHALLFNFAPRDEHRVGKSLYESPALTKIWGLGGVRIGDASPAAAAYIAQYSLKKQLHHPQPFIDYSTGEYIDPRPFLRMSLRPGIGWAWLQKHHEDLRHGYLVEGKGKKERIPRFFRTHIREKYPQLAEEVETNLQRFLMDRSQDDNNQPERRAAAEQIHKARKALSHQRSTL